MPGSLPAFVGSFHGDRGHPPCTVSVGVGFKPALRSSPRKMSAHCYFERNRTKLESMILFGYNRTK
jgi:hypothetical protein